MTTGAEVAVAVSTFWLDIAKAGIGSFFGACFAIAVAMIVEHLKKRAAILVAGNNALTILSLQYGHFVLAKWGFHDELQRVMANNPELPLCLYGRPSVTQIPENLALKPESVAFLYELKKLDLAQELLKMDFRYHDFRGTMEQVHEVALERHDRLGDELPIGNQAVWNKLGYGLIGRSEAVVLAAIRRMDRDQEGYENVGQELHRFLAEKYGETKVVPFLAAGAETRAATTSALPKLWEISRKKMFRGALDVPNQTQTPK